MARDPETIEREIEQARNALALTVDELTKKANPKRLADAAKVNAQAKLGQPRVKYSLIGGAGLLVALLLRKLIR